MEVLHDYSCYGLGKLMHLRRKIYMIKSCSCPASSRERSPSFDNDVGAMTSFTARQNVLYPTKHGRACLTGTPSTVSLVRSRCALPQTENLRLRSILGAQPGREKGISLRCLPLFSSFTLLTLHLFVLAALISRVAKRRQEVGRS
jgi:hypothetical protein